MFTCRQVQRRLSDLLDDELSPLARFWMRVHLTLCPPCARVGSGLDQTVGLLRDLGNGHKDDPPPPSGSATGF